MNRPDPRLRLEVVQEGMLAFARGFQGELCTETMLVRGVDDDVRSVEAVAAFLARLRPHVAYLAVPTRPPAEPWVRPPDEERLNAAFQLLAERLPRVELLVGFEGTAFTPAGDAAEDLLAICAVHPMREDAALAFLRRAGAGGEVLERLREVGRLRRVAYRGHVFYVPALGRRAADEAGDEVDEAGRESFPASDPPAWWAGHATR